MFFSLTDMDIMISYILQSVIYARVRMCVCLRTRDIMISYTYNHSYLCLCVCMHARTGYHDFILPAITVICAHVCVFVHTHTYKMTKLQKYKKKKKPICIICKIVLRI